MIVSSDYTKNQWLVYLKRVTLGYVHVLIMDNVSVMVTTMGIVIMPEGNYVVFKAAQQMGACASAPAQETIPWWRFMVKWRFFWSKFLYSVKSVQKGLQECVCWTHPWAAVLCPAGKGVLAACLYSETLWTSVPSPGWWGWDWCLQTSTQHSRFLTCFISTFCL